MRWLKNIIGSPQHLAAAKKQLEDSWVTSKGFEQETDVSGSSDDPTTTTTTKDATTKEELVVMVAGGMTSQLTYDGVDVCASRVAWEVSDSRISGSYLIADTLVR